MRFVQRASSALSRYPRMHRVARGLYRLVRGRAADAVTPDEIKSLLSGKGTIYFVQIGSNDGRRHDPIYELATRELSWRVLLVEPMADLFQRLQAAYGQDPRFAFANVAVGLERGTRPFYYVSERARTALPDLPYWHDQLGSFDP